VLCSPGSKKLIAFILEIPLNKTITGLSELFVNKPVIALHFKANNYEFIAWGDPIPKNEIKDGLITEPVADYIINNLFGHYYYILLNKKKKEINIGNSLFSILPLYYYQNTDKIIFSENAFNLSVYSNPNNISRRFILEMILFNYPLFNQSFFECIHLLPSNSYLNISNNNVRIIKHTKIEQYYSVSPKPWRRSVNEMSDIFLETVKKYLPDKQYCHALTGGFDGRTLVSAGSYYKKDFTCFTFGSPFSTDIQIASKLTTKNGLKYFNIQLDEKYALNNSLNCGLEFIHGSSGTATFARAHYLYSAKQLAEKTELMITGNFGSEIFRAAHVPGAVIAPNIFVLFNNNSPKNGFQVISKSDEFNALRKETFKPEWDSLKEDLLTLPCYNSIYNDFTQNQRFYIFIFEEIFRKYFGAEMINQFNYLKNRTPFLDFDFLKAIFKTGLAGIHSGFFEHNPLKRYKGQVLYAHIMKKAYPALGKLITDKGYRPDDLLTLPGKLNISKGYLKKVIRKNLPNPDPYGVANAWKINHNFWRNIPISSEFFITEEISNKKPIINKELIFKIISLSYLINKNYSTQSLKDIR
jgi:asparagine synthetase B (glutamine-hydrolysing)